MDFLDLPVEQRKKVWNELYAFADIHHPGKYVVFDPEKKFIGAYSTYDEASNIPCEPGGFIVEPKGVRNSKKPVCIPLVIKP